MTTNIFETTRNIISTAIDNGTLTVYESYDEANESLNILVTGEV